MTNKNPGRPQRPQKRIGLHTEITESRKTRAKRGSSFRRHEYELARAFRAPRYEQFRG